jgi:uncharacterized protein YfiM (DUF2279 family)
MHNQKPEWIVRVEAPPTSEADLFEDHGGLSLGGVERKAFSYWISRDAGESWSPLDATLDPDRKLFSEVTL